MSEFRAFRIVRFHARCSCSILRKKILKNYFYVTSQALQCVVCRTCGVRHTKILHMVILLPQVCNFSVLLFFAIL